MELLILKTMDSNHWHKCCDLSDQYLVCCTGQSLHVQYLTTTVNEPKISSQEGNGTKTKKNTEFTTLVTLFLVLFNYQVILRGISTKS